MRTKGYARCTLLYLSLRCNGKYLAFGRAVATSPFRKERKKQSPSNYECFAVSGGRSRDLLLNGLRIARERKDLSKKRAAQNGWLRKTPMTLSHEKVPRCNRRQPAELTHCRKCKDSENALGLRPGASSKSHTRLPICKTAQSFPKQDQIPLKTMSKASSTDGHERRFAHSGKIILAILFLSCSK